MVTTCGKCYIHPTAHARLLTVMSKFMESGAWFNALYIYFFLFAPCLHYSYEYHL